MNRTAALLAAAALTVPVALVAQTLDLPQRKAGLWEVTMTVEQPKGMPAMTSSSFATSCVAGLTPRTNGGGRHSRVAESCPLRAPNAHHQMLV